MSGVLVDIDTSNKKALKDLAEINKSLVGIKGTTDRVSSSLGSFAKGIAALAVAGGGLSYLKTSADMFTEVGNRIALVTGRTKDLVVVQKELLGISYKTASAISASASLYNSLGRSLSSMGVSQKVLLSTTETIQKAVAISGSSAESANSALIQLGQGLAAGALRGQELNSVMEQTPRLAMAIADSLGVGIGGLRKIAEEGGISSAVVMKAMQSQAAAINSEFESIQFTTSKSFSMMNQSVRELVSNFDKGAKISVGIGSSLKNNTEYFRKLAGSAEQFGTSLRDSYDSFKSGFVQIGTPLLGIFKVLGSQIAAALPVKKMVRALVSDLASVFKALDRMLGGTLSTIIDFMISFNFIDDITKSFLSLFTVTSSTEKGFERLKKTLTSGLSANSVVEISAALDMIKNGLEENSKSFKNIFYGFVHDIQYFTRSGLRFFGLMKDTGITLEVGDWSGVLTSLSDIMRGVSGAQRSFLNLGDTISSIFGPAYIDLVVSFKDSIRELVSSIGVPKSATNVVEYLRSLVTILKDYTTSALLLVSTTNSLMGKLTGGISILADSLSGVVNTIRDFSESIIYYFWKIYDEVIAHSWWTDTIDQIVSTSKNLLGQVKPGIHQFKEYVITSFKNIFDSSKLIEGISTVFSQVIETIQSTKPSYKFVEAPIAYIKEQFASIAEVYPSAMKSALMALGAVASIVFLPAGSVIKKFAITFFSLSAITSASLILESLITSLSNTSLLKRMGEGIGTLVGYLFSTAIKELPKIINGLLTFLSGFFQAFISQLPAIGGMLASVVSSLDFIGIGSQITAIGGLIMSFWVAPLLFGSKAVQSFTDSINRITGLSLFKSKKEKGGGLIANIIGTAGVPRTIGVLGALLASFGAFDSLFAGSELAKYAIQGGLLYIALAGDRGWASILNLSHKAIAGIMGGIKSALDSSSGKISGTISTILFPKNGTRIAAASKFVDAAMATVSKLIIEKSVYYGATAVSFMSSLLFGKEPSVIIESIKYKAIDILKAISIDLSRKWSDFKNTKFFQTWFGDNTAFAKAKAEAMAKGAAIGKAFQTGSTTTSKDWSKHNFNGWTTSRAGPGEAIAAAATASVIQASVTEKKIIENSKKAREAAVKIGGESGLVGTLMLGKYGKIAIIGSVITALLAFTTSANAATDSTKSFNLEATVLSDVLDTIKLSWENSPWTTAAMGIAGLVASIATLITSYKALGLAQLATAKITPLAGSQLAKQHGGKIAAGAGAAAGVALGGFDFASIMWGIMGAQTIWSVLTKRMQRQVGISIASALKGLTSLRGLAMFTGVGTIGSLIYVALFGEGNTFFDKIKNAISDISELLGLARKTNAEIAKRMGDKTYSEQAKNLLSGKDKTQTRLGSQGEIGQSVDSLFGMEIIDFGRVNLSKLSEEQKVSLEEQRVKLTDAINQVLLLRSKTGMVMAGDAIKYRDIADETNKLLDEFSVSAFEDPREQTKLLKKAFEARAFSGSKLAIWARQSKQAQLDIKFEDTMKPIEEARNQAIRDALVWDPHWIKSDELQIPALKENFLSEPLTAIGNHIANMLEKSTTDLGFSFRRVDATGSKGANIAKLTDKLNNLLSRRGTDFNASYKEYSGSLITEIEILENMAGSVDEALAIKLSKAKTDVQTQQEALTQIQGTVTGAESSGAYQRQEATVKNNISELLKVVDEVKSNKIVNAATESFNSTIVSTLDNLKRAGITDISESDLRMTPSASTALDANKVSLQLARLKEEIAKDAGKSATKGLPALFERIKAQLANQLKIDTARATDPEFGLKYVISELGLNFSADLIDMILLNSGRAVQKTLDQILKDMKSEDPATRIKARADAEREAVSQIAKAPLGEQISAYGLAGSDINIRQQAKASGELKTRELELKRLQNEGAPEVAIRRQQRLVEYSKRSISDLQEAAKKLPLSFNDIYASITAISDIPGITQSLITSGDFARVHQLDKELRGISEQLAKPVSGQRGRDLLNQRETAEAERKKLVEKQALTTYGGQTSLWSKAGFTPEKGQYELMSQKTKDDLTSAALSVVSIEEKLKSASATEAPAWSTELTYWQKIMNDLSKKLESISGQYDNIKSVFGDMSDKFFGGLGDAAKVTSDKITELKKNITESKTTENWLKAKDALEDYVKSRLKLQGGSFGLMQYQAKKSGLNLDEKSFARASTKFKFGSLISQSEHYSKLYTDSISAGKTEEAIKYLALLDEVNARIISKVDEFGKSLRDSAAYQAGISFANTISSSFSDGLKSLLKGKSSFKELLTNTLDSFTSSVIDTFVNGMMNTVTNSDMFKGIFESIGTMVFGAGEQVTGGTPHEQAMMKAENDFVNALNMFTARFGGGATSFADSSLSSIMGSVINPLGQTGIDWALDSTSIPGLSSEQITSAIDGNLLNSPFIPGGGSTFMGEPSALMPTGIINNPGAPLAKGPFSDIMNGNFIDLGNSVNGIADPIVNAAATSSNTIVANASGNTMQMMGGFAGLAGSLAAMSGSSGMGQVAGLLGVVASGMSIYSSLTAATGGYISGPGTGTSDSIPAMLSNGEFVINAAATRNNRQLLEMINNGRVPRFADGGLVSPDSTAMSMAYSSIESSASTSRQQRSNSTFNINITGDVSQQTRMEVQKMIPQIASGVNMHNYERGNRR